MSSSCGNRLLGALEAWHVSPGLIYFSPIFRKAAKSNAHIRSHFQLAAKVLPESGLLAKESVANRSPSECKPRLAADTLDDPANRPEVQRG